MSRHEWAKLLDSLRDDDRARGEALLMLSDEDWVNDAEREWLRAAAVRDYVLHPDVEPSWNLDSYPWSGGGRVRAVIPRRLLPRLSQRESNGEDYTTPYASAEKAWLDLLGAVSREGAER